MRCVVIVMKTRSKSSSVFSINFSLNSNSALNKDNQKKFVLDPPLVFLLFSNITAIIFALVGNFSIGEVFLLFWGQSVIIGFFQFLKILSLSDFSVDGFSVNGRPATKSNSTKQSTALFFAFHYGIFHAVYFGFFFEFGFSFSLASLLFVFSAWLIFFINHLFSFSYFKNKPFRRVPNLGAMMFYPYARIIPMHICIILGAVLSGTYLIVLFLVLKTVADLAMHLIEHSGQLGE